MNFLSGQNNPDNYNPNYNPDHSEYCMDNRLGGYQE